MAIPNTNKNAKPEIKRSALAGFWNFKEVNAARSLVILSLGTLIGLGIAGYGLFTAKGTVTHQVPPENVALVNQQPILRSDFIAQTEALYSMPFGDTTPDQRMRVLQDMIREELFVQRGLELGFPSNDPDTRAGLVNAVEQEISANVTSGRPSDAELKKFFEENTAKYASEGMMTLHDLVLPKEKEKEQPEADLVAQMRKVADELRQGAKVNDVKKAFDLIEAGGAQSRGSPPGNEEFYFAQKIHIGDLMFSVAQALNDGQVCDPVVADDGIHVLQMVKNVRPTPAVFERVRSQVLQDFTEAARKRLQDADEKFLRAKAEILVASDYADAYEKDVAEREAGTKPEEQEPPKPLAAKVKEAKP